jgi:uncharacterized protein YsxB (DUF464 family)
VIKANFSINKNKEYSKVELLGHALFDNYGNDIVCAAISGQFSMLELGLIGVVKSKSTITKKKDLVTISVTKDKETQILIQSFYLALKAIEINYKNYLTVEIAQ